MPWIYMGIVALLAAFIFYILDQINRMALDVKYIRMKLDK